MASECMINQEVLRNLYSLRSVNSAAFPVVRADCPAYTGRECSYYDGLCPYAGNTVECQCKEESTERW